MRLAAFRRALETGQTQRRDLIPTDSVAHRMAVSKPALTAPSVPFAPVFESPIPCVSLSHLLQVKWPRESRCHCRSPVVASMSFAPAALDSTLTRRPAPGVGFVGLRAGKLLLQKIPGQIVSNRRWQRHRLQSRPNNLSRAIMKTKSA